MENASKALLMAGGILLAILIVALILFAKNNITDYYNSKEELKEVDNIANFNLQFSNYENRDVYGYELVSLANKIIDYNFRYADVEGAKNDQKYNKIVMNINLQNRSTGRNGQNDFKFRDDQNTMLFQSSSYTIEGIEQFIDYAKRIENYYKSSDIATHLAKSIDALVLSDTQFEMDDARGITRAQSEQRALEKYNSIMKSNIYGESDFKNKDANGNLVAYNNMCRTLTAQDTSVMKYYQYYQFKKAVFKCTGIEYDDVTGRVSSISFEYEKLQ